MGWLIFIGYLLGFVVSFRLFLRHFLTWWEKIPKSGIEIDFYFFDGATPYIRATICALFFPLVLIWLALTMGVKSDQTRKKEQDAAEKAKRKEREEFKRKARDLNIPGWEHLP